MSASVDEKIVSMKFDNKQFEKGVAESIKTIDKLNKSTDLKGAKQSFDQLQKSANSLDFTKMANNVDKLAGRFSAMGIAGMTVIQDITHGALNMSKKLVGILNKPLAQIKSGGISRALNLAQAQFQIEGLGKSWEELSKDINYGVESTAYGLDAAAKVASQLSASGIEAGKGMKAALRGVSGVAAMTNSSYEEIGQIYTTIAGNGRLMSMQLLQLSSKGINAAATLAEQLGKTEAEVRDMVSHGKIDFETFSKAMDDAFGEHAKDANKTFEGSMSNVRAALSKIGALFASPIFDAAIGPINGIREGLNALKSVLEEDGGIAKQFDTLVHGVGDLATAILNDQRVLDSISAVTSGLVNIFRFLGSIFQQVATAFESIFPIQSLDRIKEAAENFKAFTENLKLSERQIYNIQTITRGVASVFKIFINLIALGKDILFDIIKSPVGDFFLKVALAVAKVVTALGEFVSGVRKAYEYGSQAFGGITGIINNFGDFVKVIGMIFEQSFSGVIDWFKDLKNAVLNGVGVANGALGGFGTILAEIGHIVTAALEGIKKFVSYISKPIADAVKKLVSSIPSELSDMVDNMTNVFKKGDEAAKSTVMFKVLSVLGTAIKLVIALLSKLGAVVRDVFTAMAKEIGTAGLGNVIEKVLNIGILMSVKQFIEKLKKITFDIGGLTGTFKTTLTEAKKSLIAFQKNMQTSRILEIAVAIGLLAGALLLLTTIKPDRVATGLGALAGTMAILVIAVRAMKETLGDGKSKGFGATAIQLIGLAVAVDILASALKKLAALDIKQVGTSLLALTGVMALLVIAVKILGTGGKKVMKGALQLVFLAEAVKVLANVVLSLKDISWEQMGKGLAGLGGILAEIVAFSKIMNKTKVKMTTATALVIIAQAIKQIIPPIKELGTTDWKILGTGLASLGILLLELAGFSVIMSKAGNKMGVFKAAAMYIIVDAITNIVGVVKQLGALNIGTIGKGLGALAGVLAELAGFAAVMSHVKGIFVDSVSILILVKALKELVPVIQSFGGMDLESLAKGLGTMAIALAAITAALAISGKGSLKSAAAFAIMAVAINTMAASIKMLGDMELQGLIAGMSALIGVIAALTAAVKLIKGSASGAAAMILLATALFIIAPALAVVGNMPIESVVSALVGIGGALAIFVVAGKAASTCVPGILALSGGIAILGAAFLAFGAGVLLFGIGANTLVDASTKIANTATDIVKAGEVLAAGVVAFIKDLVGGLSKGAIEIGKAAATIVIAIINSIVDRVPDLVDAAYRLLIGFINGLADGAEKFVPQIIDAVGRLMKSVISAFKEWFGQFAEIGTEGMVKIAAVVLAVIGILKILSSAIGNFKASNIAGALIMVAAIGGLVAGLMVLSNVPWQNLIAAAAAMSLTMTAFAGVLDFVSKIKMDLKNIGLFALGTLALIPIAAALALVATQSWASILASAASILLVLTGYTAVFMLLANSPVNPAVLTTIALFGVGTLALLPIVLALKLLASEDYASILAAAASLTAVMLAYTGVFVVMGAIPISMALAAVANLAIAIVGIAAIIALMGAIKQIPGFEWLINEGGTLLMKIGEIIGGFIGSIIAGAGKAISSVLPQLGADLSAFMINATPFIMGMKLIDDSLIKACLSLAGAVLVLSAAELINGIASFMGANFTDLGGQLAQFAHGVVDFAEITKDLDASKVEAAASAAALLAQLAGDMPLEGGLLGAIMGDRMHLDTFGGTLKELGTGIKDFAAEVKDLNQGDVAGGAAAASLLLSLAQDMPLEGGLLGMIMGDRIHLDTFGNTLPALGTGLSQFAANVKDLNNADVTKGAIAAQMMINLAKDMPSTGGVLGFIMGNAASLDEFGETLPPLGEGLKKFADNVQGLDTNAATNAAMVAQMLSALANGLPDSGGIKSWFEGDNTLDDFGDQLPGFGEDIKAFSDNVTGLDAPSVISAASAIKAVVTMMEVATEKGFNSSDIKAFGDNIETIGSKYRQFALDTMSASTTGPENFKKGVELLVEACNEINSTDTSKAKSFFDDLKGLTSVGVNDISTAVSSSMDGALKSVNDKISDFKEAGKNIMAALQEGIDENKTKVTVDAKVAALAVGDETVKATKTNAKKVEKAAKESIPDAQAKGIKKGKKNVKSAAKEVSNAAVNEVKKSEKKMSKSGKAAANNYSSNLASPQSVTDAENAGKALSASGALGTAQNEPAYSETGATSATNYSGNLSTNNALVDAFNGGSFLSNNGVSGVLSNTHLFKNAADTHADTYTDELGNKINSNLDSMGLSEIATKFGVKLPTKEKNKGNDSGGTTTTPTTTSASSGGGGGSSKKSGGGSGGGSSKPEWTEKDMKTAMKNYHEIVGKFVKDTKDYSSKFLKIGIDKKGLGFIKATGDYLKSGINNKYLRTAADTFGADIVKTINKSVNKEIRDDKTTKSIVKKLDAAGKKLREAQSDKKEAQKILKNTKSSKKQIAAAKKELAAANKDIAKYQKQVDKYEKSLTKVGNKIVKSETKKQLKELTKQYSDFKKQFNSIQKGLGTSLAKIPKAVGTYIKNSKKASSYAKSTVSAYNKIFGKGGESAVSNYAKRLYENSDQYKEDIKNLKKLNKEHAKNVKDAEDLKNKIKKTSNKKLKKKYAEELAQLKKDDKALLKELNKQVTAIAKGPAKALNEYKKSLVESYKSFVDISNWNIAPRFELSGFSAMKEATNTFSIFGDVTSGLTKSFDMFGVSMSKSVNQATEAFDVLNASMDTGMNLLERFTKTGTVEKEALIENADSQLEAYEEFYNGIDELRKKGFDDQLVDDLESQGPQAMNYVRGFLNMNDEEISSYNDRINKKYEWEAKVLEKNMKKQLSQYEKFNAQIEELAAKGLSEGIVEKLRQSGVSQSEYVKAMLRMDQAAIGNISDIYKRSIDIGSINSTAYYAGSEAGISYVDALEQEMNINDAWDADLKKLAEKGVRPEIIAQFKNMGKDQAGAYVASLLNETESGIAKVNDIYDRYIVSSTKSFLEAAEENRDAKQKYNDTMAELRKVAAENGLNPEVVRAIESMAADEAMVYARSIISNVQDIPKINEIYAQSNSSVMDTMTNSIHSQVEAAAEYEADYAQASARLAGVLGEKERDKYMRYLEEMGLDGAEYIKALANATDEQIQKFRDEMAAREEVNRKERARATMKAYEDQIAGLENYEENLKALVKRGASQEMVDSIAKMAATDPLAASEKIKDLLSLSEGEFKKLNKEYTAAMKKDVETMTNKILADYAGVGNKIDKAKEKTKKKSKKAGKDAVTDASSGAKEGVKENTKTLTETGTEMGKIVGKAASKETSSQVAKMSVNSVADKMDSAVADKTVQKKLKSAGKSIVKGISDGIAANEAATVAQAETTAKAIYRQFSSRFTQAKGTSLAKRFITAISSTLKSYHDPTVKQAKSIADDVYNAFATRLTYSNGYYFGYNMALGVAVGLESMYYRVRAAADRIIQAANEAAQAASQVNSPSKLWKWFGNMMGEGLAIGLENETQRVTDASTNLVDSATDSLANTMTTLLNGINGEIDVNPVITPTLDLSRVTMQARQLNSMIDGQRIGAVLQAEEQVSQNQNGGVVQNFTQNNYSPKSLSQEEIYRQTKNQFALAKEAVRI